MIEDIYSPPFTVQLINNFIDRETLNYLFKICETAHFSDGIQVVDGKKVVKPSVKIRYDYALTREQCSHIDYNLINKTKLGMTHRENWRILYYDGDQKGFRGRHTDWYKDQYEYRRISMIIGLSDPKTFEGGELHFHELNLTLKLERNCCVLFDSKMFHEVKPVTKGKRFVLQTFLFDDPAWETVKNSKVKSRYHMIPPPPRSISTTPEWEILEGQSLVNPKQVYYHMEYIGKFNDYTKVLPILNNSRNEVYAFTWFKPQYPDGNLAGRIIGWTLGRMMQTPGPFPVTNPEHVISGRIKNYMNHVHSGKYIITSETHEEKALENLNYIIPITPDSGPGNQVITIKEAMLMGKFTDRKVAAPPIVQHYMSDRNKGRKGEYKLWNFSEIFDTNNLVEDLSEFHLTECYSNYKVSIMPDFVKCTSKWDQSIVKNKENVVVNKILSKESDYEFLKSNHDRAVMISGLFNRTRFSQCCTNGCDTCPMNPGFLEDYSEICKNFDFSQRIKVYAETFIKDKNLESGFNALHLRFDDLGKETYDVDAVISKIKESSDLPIFIATNCPKKITRTDVFLFQESLQYDELESFIEQYICCRSVKFYYNGGGLSRKDTGHLRSTWSSFVVDYRKYKLVCNDNYYLKNATS